MKMISAKYYKFPHLFGFIEGNIFTVFFCCMAKKAAKSKADEGSRQCLKSGHNRKS